MWLVLRMECATLGFVLVKIREINLLWIFCPRIGFERNPVFETVWRVLECQSDAVA